MAAADNTARFLGSITLIASITAFIVGSGPFTPGLVMAAVAIPLAVLIIFLGARRLALATLYWAVAAFMPVPLSRWTDFRVDYVLVFLGFVGILVTLGLYFHYMNARRSPQIGS